MIKRFLSSMDHLIHLWTNDEVRQCEMINRVSSSMAMSSVTFSRGATYLIFR